jgi:ATP-dependent Clp protease protease subunit
MARLTAEQTGHDIEEILRDGDRDAWYTADEAVRYGFADRVISSQDLFAGIGRTALGAS